MRALIPNSTQIPDVILDHWMAELSGAEFKVLMYIARRTYGFGKHEDAISLKQIVGGIVKRDGTRLDRGTGLNKDTVCKALTALEARGIVLREQRADETYGDLPNSYSLNLVLPEEEPEANSTGPVSEKPTRGGEKNTPGPVGKSDTGSKAKNPTRGVSDFPTGGESDKTTGGSRKNSQTRVVESDTQETDQETVLQETATTGRDFVGDAKAAIAVAADSPSAFPEEVVVQSARLLESAGFSVRDSAAIAAANPPEVVREQIEWLAFRSVTKNRLGLLRKAIEESWPKPETDEQTQKQEKVQAQEARLNAKEARRQEIVGGLRSMYSRLESDAPQAYQEFLGYIEEKKAREATRPLISQSPKRLEAMLAAYDQEETRLSLMVEFFGERSAPFSEFDPLLASLKANRHQPLERLLASPG